MVGNTGRFLDGPSHRRADGADLAGLPLERLADLPAVVVRTAGSGRRAVGVDDLAGQDVAGCAVLLHTGGDGASGTPATPWTRPSSAGTARSGRSAGVRRCWASTP